MNTSPPDNYYFPINSRPSPSNISLILIQFDVQRSNQILQIKNKQLFRIIKTLSQKFEPLLLEVELPKKFPCRSNFYALFNYNAINVY